MDVVCPRLVGKKTQANRSRAGDPVTLAEMRPGGLTASPARHSATLLA